MVEARRLTLLLDAINEIPYAKDAAIRHWKDFLRLYLVTGLSTLSRYTQHVCTPLAFAQFRTTT
ncbi:MAG: hypothetical protein ACREXR_24135 [Gammaproteobacteria bacterium]